MNIFNIFLYSRYSDSGRLSLSSLKPSTYMQPRFIVSAQFSSLNIEETQRRPKEKKYKLCFPECPNIYIPKCLESTNESIPILRIGGTATSNSKDQPKINK
ncbi:unnamed protein product [Musa acuminata subsp. malaccensis]|uniref:(wild Malaysian banana) hypothetical protein n=1 Tax=Musa acuminata subsp. malaccensis TaxID=214687 RepID=A0A804K2U0_MUSAM|nr:unnamed protein product [Musa acuminata subsp. malaccensis]